MKYLTLFLLVAFASCKKENHFTKATHIPSKLDSLTPAGIEYLVQVTDSNFYDFTLRAYTDYRFHDGYGPDSIVRQIANRFKIDKTFYKADFDNNGYTDILALGDVHWCRDSVDNHFCRATSLVLMNFGKDSIRLCPLSDEMFYPLPVLPQLKLQKDTLPLITLHTFDSEAKHKPVTLIYKHGGFVELTPKKINHTIEKVQLTVGGCDGNCPQFSIELNNDKSASFYALYNNFRSYVEEYTFLEEDRYFQTKVNQPEFDDIMGVLHYIDFESLEDDYVKGGYGGRPARLIITYNGGKTKTIRDYMLQGSYGLRVIYDHFHKLRFNQNWKEVKNKPQGLNKRFDNLYPDRK